MDAQSVDHILKNVVLGKHFDIKWKDRNVSIADCVGYIMAKELGIKFLTGDKKFKDLNDVEFVK
ncbi:hypothetical protein J4416_04875 [Candidatus Pacearchaeota archaeon]|nr:hypothetical protein [Candidatus Pacearchaeota archaeon]